MPFANPGDEVHSVDSVRRRLVHSSTVTTITTDDWSLLFSDEEGKSELYNLNSDPSQLNNVISGEPEVAKDVHRLLVEFMRKTNLPDRLIKPRLELHI